MSTSAGGRSAKTALRAELLEGRRRRPAGHGADGIAGVALDWPPVSRAATVAAYVSVGREPGTDPLLDALRARGTRVLLPVLLPDGDLDWAAYDGTDDLVPAGRGLLEPARARLGLEALRQADVVLVPGLAVSAAGDRLGRGGGSYDRALARVPAGTPVAVVLHDDEVGLAVPVEAHDRRVTHALTPSGVVAMGTGSGTA